MGTYKFELKNEIKGCLDCPLISSDDYGAYGCSLINDYIHVVDLSTEIDKRCTLLKDDKEQKTTEKSNYTYFKLRCEDQENCMHALTAKCNRCARNELPIRDNYVKEVKFNIKSE